MQGSAIEVPILHGHMTKIEKDSELMTELENAMNLSIIDTATIFGIDVEFILDFVMSDIKENIDFYTGIRTSRGVFPGAGKTGEIFCELDRLNSIYVPAEFFVERIIPGYVKFIILSGFSGPIGIRGLLDVYANEVQNSIERATIAASEEEFKESNYGIKTTNATEISSIISKHVKESKASPFPLEECHVCGNEDVHHFYKCTSCSYEFCKECCENIAGRQARCPCCNEDFSLIENVVPE